MTPKSLWHIRSISFSFSQVCRAAGTALCWATDWDQVHSTFLSFSLDQDSSPHGGGPDKRLSQTTGARLKSLLSSCPLMYSIGQSKSYAKSDTSEWGTYTLIPLVGGTVEQHGKTGCILRGWGKNWTNPILSLTLSVLIEKST